MINRGHGATGMVLRLLCILMTYLWLSGCAALPPVLDYASMALSTISYLTTGKGPSDHAVSYAMKKDCSLLRALALKPVCIEVTADTNIPFWVQLLKKKPVEFPASETPMPPRIIDLPNTAVVQLD